MTTTVYPDLTALTRAVCRFPDDDTPRLVLADWLDEHARTASCRAHGCKSGQVYAMRQCRDGIMRNAWADCPTCHGTGTVSDGFAERAELIRVQCELARLHAAGHGMGATVDCPVIAYARKNQRAGGQMMPKCRKCDDAMELEYRERALLTDARRDEWSGIKCPVCKGSKRWDYYDSAAGEVRPGVACSHCSGTGFAPVEFRRGFVDRVTCRMGDVLRERSDTCPQCFGYPLRETCRQCHGCGSAPKWQLTPWARGVLAAHPVTRWEITDREPEEYMPQTDVERICGWLSDEHLGNRLSAACLPSVVYHELRENGDPTGFFAGYISDELARDALALAVGRVARQLAGLPEVTP